MTLTWTSRKGVKRDIKSPLAKFLILTFLWAPLMALCGLIHAIHDLRGDPERHTYREIRCLLRGRGIPSPEGRPDWPLSTIERVCKTPLQQYQAAAVHVRGLRFTTCA